MWECLKCGELVDGDFEVCWSCGASQSGEEDPEFRKADEYRAEEEPSTTEVSDLEGGGVPQSVPVDLPPTARTNRPIPPPVLPCLRCGSQQIIPSASLEASVPAESRGILQARVDTDPDAWILKGRTRSRLFARICGKCGHTEIYVSNPELLWEAYEEQQQNHGG